MSPPCGFGRPCPALRGGISSGPYEMKDDTRGQQCGFLPKDGGFQCEVRFVDVLGADGKLNESVGEEILGFQDKTGSCAVLKLYSLEQPRFSLNLREELGDRDRWIVNFLQVYWK